MRNYSSRSFIRVAAVSGIIISLCCAATALAFVEPTAAPPSGNVSAPINVGSTAQFRVGSLGIGTNANAAQMLEVNGSIQVDGSRLITGSDGANYFWIKNAAGTEAGGNISYGYQTDGAGVVTGLNMATDGLSRVYINSSGVGIFNSTPAANSLTVDNTAHTMQFCLNGTDAAHCTNTIGGGGGTNYWTLGGGALVNNQGSIVNVQSVLQAVNPNPGSGYATINSGNTTNAGFNAWFRPNGQRLGYLGWDPTNLNLNLENGANFIISNGNVGIGTVSPLGKLSVMDTIGGLITGLTVTPYHQPGVVAGTQLNASDNNGTSRVLELNANGGSVGIGTSNPPYRLTVAPGGNGSGLGVHWNASGGTGETDFYNYGQGGPGGFTFYNYSAPGVSYPTSGAQKLMEISSSGNLGISGKSPASANFLTGGSGLHTQDVTADGTVLASQFCTGTVASPVCISSWPSPGSNYWTAYTDSSGNEIGNTNSGNVSTSGRDANGYALAVPRGGIWANGTNVNGDSIAATGGINATGNLKTASNLTVGGTGSFTGNLGISGKSPASANFLTGGSGLHTQDVTADGTVLASQFCTGTVASPVCTSSLVPTSNTDTLDIVTGRGNTTAHDITVGADIVNGALQANGRDGSGFGVGVTNGGVWINGKSTANASIAATYDITTQAGVVANSVLANSLISNGTISAGGNIGAASKDPSSGFPGGWAGLHTQDVKADGSVASQQYCNTGGGSCVTADMIYGFMNRSWQDMTSQRAYSSPNTNNYSNDNAWPMEVSAGGGSGGFGGTCYALEIIDATTGTQVAYGGGSQAGIWGSSGSGAFVYGTIPSHHLYRIQQYGTCPLSYWMELR